MRSRSLFRAAGVVAVGTTAAVVLTGTASAEGSSPSSAVVVSPAAARGGAVIVSLRNQLQTVRVRGTQGKHRKSEARKSQAGVVQDISAHGGTHITSLVSVNAVAAHVSAAEVDTQDDHQLVTLGVSAVGPEMELVRGVLQAIQEGLRAHPVAEYLGGELRLGREVV